MRKHAKYTEQIDAIRQHSNEILDKIRWIGAEQFGTAQEFVVGVNGSLARREFTSRSDIDLFFLSLNGDVCQIRDKQKHFRTYLESIGLKCSDEGSSFTEPLKTGDILAKIGGDDDINTFITRRILFLLEGEWVFNESGFVSFRQELIGRYVDRNLHRDKVCMFLLNDIIRYWRTVCVDYEHKVTIGKPKSIRLLKLRFSRMIIYFSGIIAIDQTRSLQAEEKRKCLETLFSMTPIDRIQTVFGAKADKALSLYANFLRSLDDKLIREKLEQPDDIGIDTEEYKLLAQNARAFKNSLLNLLNVETDSTSIVPSLIL